MITKFARLELELFTKPSQLDFLRFHQVFGFLDYPVKPDNDKKLKAEFFIIMTPSGSAGIQFFFLYFIGCWIGVRHA